MIVALLIAAAAVLLWWDWILEHLRIAAESPWLRGLEARHLVGIAMLAAAFAAWAYSSTPAAPPPPPPPPGSLVLAGLFRGESAADDAATLAALCGALADCVEHDGQLPQPRLTSGVAINELRVAARDARLRGGSIGDRQPAVRDAVHAYLDRDDVLGPSGGPIDAAQRARWVAAFRSIAAAAEAAIR